MRSRTVLVVIAAFATAVLATGDGVAEPAAPAPLAVAPGGSDAGRCTRARPCASLGRAYDVAAPGQLVEVAAGRYGPQDITARPSPVAGSAPVVIQPASGARVTIAGRLTIAGATGLTLRNLRFDPVDPYWDVLVDACSANVTLRNFVARRFFVLEGTNKITIKGGSWGGYSAPGDGDSAIGTSVFSGPLRTCNGQPAGPATDVLIDGATFHDVFWNVPQSNWGGSHPDCFEINGYVRRVTVRNSLFVRCASTFMQINPDTGPLTDVVFERNTFRQLGRDTYFGIQLISTDAVDACQGWVFRDNLYLPSNPAALTPNSPIRVECLASRVTRIENNVFQRGPSSHECTTWRRQTASVWSANIFTDGSACGTTQQLPWGYRADQSGLAVDASIARAVQRVVRLVAGGQRPPLVAATARKERLPRPRRGAWRSTDVRSIVANDGYAGAMWGRPGSHRPIVTKSLLTRAQRALESPG